LLAPHKPDIKFGVFFYKKISLEISQSENAKSPLNLCIFKIKNKNHQLGKVIAKVPINNGWGPTIIVFFSIN
jgi:hypothetical protein